MERIWKLLLGPEDLLIHTYGLIGASTLTMHVASLLASALVTGLALAHPGHDHNKEMAERREYLATRKTDLSHCSEKVRERGLHKRALQRRQKLADELFVKRGLNSMFVIIYSCTSGGLERFDLVPLTTKKK
jgi:hypothetical protein